MSIEYDEPLSGYFCTCSPLTDDESEIEMARRCWERQRAYDEAARRDRAAGDAGPDRICNDCGQPFRPEGSVVYGLDKILCVPCIGAALARVTD